MGPPGAVKRMIRFHAETLTPSEFQKGLTNPENFHFYRDVFQLAYWIDEGRFLFTFRVKKLEPPYVGGYGSGERRARSDAPYHAGFGQSDLGECVIQFILKTF
jgi:hypothetical protein